MTSALKTMTYFSIAFEILLEDSPLVLTSPLSQFLFIVYFSDLHIIIGLILQQLAK